MLRPGPAKQLTIYLQEGDKHHHEPLTRILLDRARQMGLAGVTLWRAAGGIDHKGELHHNAQSEFFIANLPVMIQIVDREEKVQAFARAVFDYAPQPFMTVADVTVLSGPS